MNPVEEELAKRCIEFLEWVYTTDPESIETSEEYRLHRGEYQIPTSVEEQKKSLGYSLKKNGRRNPVANLATILIDLLPESEQEMVFCFIELSETDLYLRQNHSIPPLLRTSSFLQHVLNERLDEEMKLHWVIQESYKEGEISMDELKLSQFIRSCRNDVGHNFWYDTEFSFVVHNQAALSCITLLNSLLESWYNVEWYVENRLNARQAIRIIEEEFGLEWDGGEYKYEESSLKDKYNREEGSGEFSDVLEVLSDLRSM